MHDLLTQLEASRQTILESAHAGKVASDELLKLANTEADSTLALVSVSTDPLTHLVEAHQEARLYLEQFVYLDPTLNVTSGSGFRFTPRKTLRRVLDHALDHLNQIEQWLAWQQQSIIPTPTDGWAGSAITLEEDTLPLSSADLNAWLWRIDMAVNLVRQRVEQLASEQLDWKPPDGGWTLRQILHHLASGEVYYSIWFHQPLPEEPMARYVEANRRFYEQARGVLRDDMNEGRAFINDELGVFTADKVVRDIIKMEKRVAA